MQEFEFRSTRMDVLLLRMGVLLLLLSYCPIVLLLIVKELRQHKHDLADNLLAGNSQRAG